MFKKLLFSAVFAACVINANAQKSVQLSYQLGLPASQYSGNMGMSIAGANLKFAFWKDDYIRFNLGSGFYQVPYKEVLVDGVPRTTDAVVSFVPVTFGGEFYFLGETNDKQPSKIKPFIGVDIGYMLALQSESDQAPATNRNHFMFAPTFGIAYKMSESMDFFGAIRNNIILYERQGVLNYLQPFQLVGINIGFNFKL
jgi:outer membrane protein W